MTHSTLSKAPHSLLLHCTHLENSFNHSWTNLAREAKFPAVYITAKTASPAPGIHSKHVPWDEIKNIYEILPFIIRTSLLSYLPRIEAASRLFDAVLQPEFQTNKNKNSSTRKKFREQARLLCMTEVDEHSCLWRVFKVSLVSSVILPRYKTAFFNTLTILKDLANWMHY